MILQLHSPFSFKARQQDFVLHDINGVFLSFGVFKDPQNGLRVDQ